MTMTLPTTAAAWRDSWRQAVAPRLPEAGLVELADALRRDDSRLVQANGRDPDLCDGGPGGAILRADAIGYALWQGHGLTTTAGMNRRVERLVFGTDPEGRCHLSAWPFLEWYDATPRGEMRRELLAEVEREISRRRTQVTQADNHQREGI
jgi:hypothetical protein